MNSWDRVLDFWDKDWKGDSWNGRNLRDELAAHSAAQASDSGSLEGYTVWGIALHVLRIKEMLLAELDGRTPVWPEGEERFPAVPQGGLTENRWAEIQALLAKTHDALLAKVRTLDEVFLETKFQPWDVSWGNALTWASSHDVYHVTQIRNMKPAA